MGSCLGCRNSSVLFKYQHPIYGCFNKVNNTVNTVSYANLYKPEIKILKYAENGIFRQPTTEAADHMAKAAGKSTSFIDELTVLNAAFVLADKHLSQFDFDNARGAKEWGITHLPTNMPVDATLFPSDGIYGFSTLVSITINDESFRVIILLNGLDPLTWKAQNTR